LPQEAQIDNQHLLAELLQYLLNHGVEWRQQFVDNVQHGEDDCKRYYVNLDELRELVMLCQKVSQNHSIAELLLPTQEGFFFGSYEYDEMYFLDIQETLTFLVPVINDQTWENWDFYYQSSW